MSEAASQPETAAQPALEDKSFHDVLRGLVGKVVTFVNPESHEDAPLGFQLRAGWYKAKPVSLGNDFITVMTEFKHSDKEKTKEPVKQFIPISRIKRISIMKGGTLIHL